MRYRLNNETGVLHDTRAKCDDAHKEGLEKVDYFHFRDLLGSHRADPCDHCFRDDELEVGTPVRDWSDHTTALRPEEIPTAPEIKREENFK